MVLETLAFTTKGFAQDVVFGYFEVKQTERRNGRWIGHSAFSF